jgi:hypothetical protein
MRPIKGSVKCHANSIPAALSKLSCSPGWRCFSYLPPSYPPDPQGLEADMVEPGLAVDLGESIARLANVRFGSKADMCSAKRHVCFTPKSGHLSSYSITSSAVVSNLSGTERPSAFALLRLMVRSNFVD